MKSHLLQELLHGYHQSQYIQTDPIQFAHRFRGSTTQEIVAFLSACFSYGSASQIIKTLDGLFNCMQPDPVQFLLDRKSYPEFVSDPVLKDFYYRFHTHEHLAVLLSVLHDLLQQYGGLGAWAKALGEFSEDENITTFLEVFSNSLKEKSFQKLKQYGREDLGRGMKFFFNSPSDGSSCKRMNMFLRWMVRKDEIDFGLWNWLSPHMLIIPVDTHVARISYYLGLRGGNEDQAPQWKMANEITGNLRKINALDPVVYDFSITRLGIMKLCKKNYEKSICSSCPLLKGCRFASHSRAK